VSTRAPGGDGDDNAAAPTKYNDDPKVLNIVMGSEQRLVFDQIVRPWCEKNKLTCDAAGLLGQQPLLTAPRCVAFCPPLGDN
jgi:Ca-activated chloride channel family protein